LKAEIQREVKKAIYSIPWANELESIEIEWTITEFPSFSMLCLGSGIFYTFNLAQTLQKCLVF
jgi:hypothetical protein